jgi:hypothetical protein
MEICHGARSRERKSHNLYSAPDIEWLQASVMVTEKSWRFGRIWKCNILVDLQKVACDAVDWIQLAKYGISFGIFEYCNEPSGFKLI